MLYCVVTAGKFIVSVLVYIAEVVLPSGEAAAAADTSENSLCDGEQMDSDVQELATDVDNVRMFSEFYMNSTYCCNSVCHLVGLKAELDQSVGRACTSVCLFVKMSHSVASRLANDADVSADDVDTVSGLLEAAAVLLMGIQPALEKVFAIDLCRSAIHRIGILTN